MSVPLIAASEFLTAWIALTLRLLLTDQRFAARWTGGRIALDDALDEVLWREAPAANPPLPRYAMQDLELDGKLIRKGDALIMAVAAANQDPLVHTGDMWDEVGNRAHLAWGVGPHRCPASRQARIVARVAINRLLTDKRFAARWTGGRIALDDALDEVLWREAPAANPPLPRYAMQDLELDGKLIRKGDALIMAVAAANQDPLVHTGNMWDEVGNRAHLAWGVGPHRCPASRQARIIARVAINRLLTELDLELAVQDHDLAWVPSPWVRHPQALPVRYQRARSSGTEIYEV